MCGSIVIAGTTQYWPGPPKSPLKNTGGNIGYDVGGGCIVVMGRASIIRWHVVTG